MATLCTLLSLVCPRMALVSRVDLTESDNAAEMLTHSSYSLICSDQLRMNCSIVPFQEPSLRLAVVIYCRRVLASMMAG